MAHRCCTKYKKDKIRYALQAGFKQAPGGLEVFAYMHCKLASNKLRVALRSLHMNCFEGVWRAQAGSTQSEGFKQV